MSDAAMLGLVGFAVVAGIFCGWAGCEAWGAWKLGRDLDAQKDDGPITESDYEWLRSQEG